eukprot:NODE_872_length_3382_cov_0.843131.p2 type:complete len:193 gc:universal NODE_872_length_3382_cov_0.843131:2574-3152(+)
MTQASDPSQVASEIVTKYHTLSAKLEKEFKKANLDLAALKAKVKSSREQLNIESLIEDFTSQGVEALGLKGYEKPKLSSSEVEKILEQHQIDAGTANAINQKLKNVLLKIDTENLDARTELDRTHQDLLDFLNGSKNFRYTPGEYTGTIKNPSRQDYRRVVDLSHQNIAMTNNHPVAELVHQAIGKVVAINK